MRSSRFRTQLQRWARSCGPVPTSSERPPPTTTRCSDRRTRAGPAELVGSRRTVVSMSDGSEIRFLQFGDRRVAYAVDGTGPSLVTPAWWVSHLELDWSDQAYRSLWESVGEGRSLVRYDRLGVGMSDREVRDEDLTLDGEVALLRAVLDEVAQEKVTLIGGSSGG